VQPVAGLKFAHYELLSKLGKGGMGEVWRARDHSLGRDVAVKFIVEEAAHSTRVVRFEREARAASALNHPNIVTVHAFGWEQERAYLVLELVLGRSLRDMMAGRALPLAQGIDVARQVADGLARAHAAGIVHRDLKPENIMVTDDGLVKILDFGLVKLVRSSDHPTDDTVSREDARDISTLSRSAEGMVVGTVGYMSPEQARGQEVDHRSDQFALGSILYEMICGRRAFQKATSVETLVSIITEEPPPPGADVPVPLRWVVERLLAKDADHRYASTLDLARELRALPEHLHELGRLPTRPSPRPPAAPGRRWATWAAAVAVAVALAAALAWTFRAPLLRLAGRAALAPSGGHVAVLPFKYVGTDARGPALCEGLVEILSSKLTQLEHFQGTLTVVPAAEVAGAGVVTPSAAQRRFGATLVVTGTVEERAGRIRVHASVVDAGAMRQLRSIEVEESTGELFRLEDRLLERLMGMLLVSADPGARELLTAGETSDNAAYGAYVQARGLLQRHDRPGQAEQAVTLLAQAVQRDPSYALAHAALGEAYWQQYQQSRNPDLVRRARESCDRALALNPRAAPAYVTLAMLDRGTGRPADAVQHADQALALDAMSADAHRERARALEDLGELRKAEEAYRQAVQLRPNDWNVFTQLGGFLNARGRFAEARDAFTRVTQLTPDNTSGWNNRGSMELALGNPEAARRDWETSLGIAPTGTAYSNLGTLAFFDGRYAEAARHLEEAVKARPNDHRLWANLGAARYWAPGEREKAGAAYRRAVELAEREREMNPRNAALLARLADSYAMLGQAREARAALAQALSLAPQDTRVMFTAGETYEQLGDRDLAIRWVAAALAAGHSRREIDRAPGLAGVRADARFKEAVAGK
jgi:tetratricopeptide (TPR) repeat protein/tRNA A-37 threonylcarbamoyl transferase component Bud32